MIQKLFVLDTETSGLDPEVHGILSLAGVVWIDGRIVECFEVYVREPGVGVDPESMAINKIDLAFIDKNGIEPKEVVERLEGFLSRFFDLHNKERVTIVCHNAAFDIPFLKSLYKRAGASFGRVFSHRAVDTAGILRFLILAGRLPPSTGGSDEAFCFFDIEIPKKARHTALGDAIGTARLLSKLLDFERRGFRPSSEVEGEMTAMRHLTPVLGT